MNLTSKKFCYSLIILTILITGFSLFHSIGTGIFTNGKPQITTLLLYKIQGDFYSLTQYILQWIATKSNFFFDRSTILLDTSLRFGHLLIYIVALTLFRKVSPIIKLVTTLLFCSFLLLTNIFSYHPTTDIILMTSILVLSHFKRDRVSNIVFIILNLLSTIFLSPIFMLINITFAILNYKRDQLRFGVATFSTLVSAVLIYINHHKLFFSEDVLLSNLLALVILYLFMHIPKRIYKAQLLVSFIVSLVFIYLLIESIFLKSDIQYVGYLDEDLHNYTLLVFLQPLITSLFTKVNEFKKRVVVILLALLFLTFTSFNLRFINLYNKEVKSFYSEFNEEPAGCYYKTSKSHLTFYINQENAIYYSIALREKLNNNKVIFLKKNLSQVEVKYCNLLRQGYKLHQINLTLLD